MKEVDYTVLATVRGQALNELPKDLYIPPDALEILLENFSGPLDLLLYLIRKQNLDILDIPVTQITEQYIHYITLLRPLKIALASDYLVMAATLIEIKSRMLLPKPPSIEAEEEDPRQALANHLQVYAQIQAGANFLNACNLQGRDVFLALAQTPVFTADPPPKPAIDFNDLTKAWQRILQRAAQQKPHQITKENLSVSERMITITQRLIASSSLKFTQLLINDEAQQGIAVTFLAILSLQQQLQIEITQTEPFAEIEIHSIKTCLHSND